MEKMVIYPAHTDDEYFDEVRIKVVPRFKTSELSGDEWRVSAHAQALRKGIVVAERSWTKLEYALRLLDAWLIEVGETGRHVNTENLCFQAGCNKPATVEYRVKQPHCVGPGNCGQPLDRGSTEYRIRFCDSHRHRGDADLQDNDANYEIVEA